MKMAVTSLVAQGSKIRYKEMGGAATSDVGAQAARIFDRYGRRGKHGLMFWMVQFLSSGELDILRAVWEGGHGGVDFKVSGARD